MAKGRTPTNDNQPPTSSKLGVHARMPTVVFHCGGSLCRASLADVLRIVQRIFFRTAVSTSNEACGCALIQSQQRHPQDSRPILHSVLPGRIPRPIVDARVDAARPRACGACGKLPPTSDRIDIRLATDRIDIRLAIDNAPERINLFTTLENPRTRRSRVAWSSFLSLC